MQLSSSISLSKDDPAQIPSGEFKYDMEWQKRGSGRCDDSKSWVGIRLEQVLPMTSDRKIVEDVPSMMVEDRKHQITVVPKIGMVVQKPWSLTLGVV